jgi:hypothetical protein
MSDRRGPGVAPVRTRVGAPARLGLTLRSVALSPRAGFAAAIKTGDRRARAGERLPEGAAPYVLAAVGGAGAMVAWLKLGALAGWRSASSADFDSSVLAATLVLGALLSLAGQALWGVAAARALDALGSHARRRHLRLVWGASGLPQVFVLLVLLPGDLAIAGPASLTTDALGDPVATAWAAVSIALTAAAAAWSLWIFWRGVEVAGGLNWRRTAPVALLGPLATALWVVALALVAIAVA